jgi:hypothetical protein
MKQKTSLPQIYATPLSLIKHQKPFLCRRSSGKVSVNFAHSLKKILGGEIPGEQLAPVVGGTHFSGFLKDTG